MHHKSNIAFRVDASTNIGTGHVWRCLTLAKDLRQLGYECDFICANLEGNLSDLISKEGFELKLLDRVKSKKDIPKQHLDCGNYAEWLGTSWQEDSKQTKLILERKSYEIIVVDHYALDFRWEKSLRNNVSKIMVIDDLADRVHDCDLILDQNLGRQSLDYCDLVPNICIILCGLDYALIRSEFRRLRSESLRRRKNSKLKNLLISMGGVDKNNVTSKVIKALRNAQICSECEITIILGSTAPWIEQVKKDAQLLKSKNRVLCDVRNIAQLMAESDLAIGAAGSSSWERCCMGLPSIVVELARNQREISLSLAKAGASLVLKTAQLDDEFEKVIKRMNLKSLSSSASSLVDGLGAKRVSEKLDEILSRS